MLSCEGIDFGAFNGQPDWQPYTPYVSAWSMSQYAYYTNCVKEVGTVTISAGQMAQLTADSQIDCTLTTSKGVDFCCKYYMYPQNPDYAKVTFSIDSGKVSLFVCLKWTVF